MNENSSDRILTINCPYNDLAIRIVGSFLIAFPVIIMGNEDVLGAFLNSSFYFDWVISALSGFILWSILRLINRRLDINYNWMKSPVVRGLHQFFWGVIMIGLGALGITYLQFNYIYSQSIIETGWLLFEFPMVIVLIILINAYYLIYHLVWTSKHRRDAGFSVLNENEFVKDLIVTRGNKSVPISLENAVIIYRKDQLNYLVTSEGQTYMLTENSLDELMSRLNPLEFFRGNRQCILSRSKIDSFQPIENGKIKVSVTGIDNVVVVSQKTASRFRKWIKTSE